jgi:hypothetical protein
MADLPPGPYEAMMKCGHAGNAWVTLPNGDRKVCCVICAGITGGDFDTDPAYLVDPEVDLSGRMARCSYALRNHEEDGSHQAGKVRGSAAGQPDQPSSFRLAFFAHKPDQPMDEYYCGCWGWD